MPSKVDQIMDMDTTLDYSITLGEFAYDFLLSVLPRAIGFGCLAFIVSLFVLVFIHRKKLYKRANPIWNLLTKLHYLIWIVLFVIVGLGWGALSATKSQALEAIDERLEPYLISQFPLLEEFVIHDLPIYIGEKTIITARDVTKSLDNYLLQSLQKSPEPDGIKARFIRSIGYKLNRKITVIMLELVVKKFIEDLGARLHLGHDVTEFTVEAFMSADFSSLKQEIIPTAVVLARDQTSSLENALVMKLVLYFMVFALFLLAEPFFYYRFWVPQKMSHDS